MPNTLELKTAQRTVRRVMRWLAAYYVGRLHASHVNLDGVGQVEKRDKKIADLTRGLEALEMIKNGRQLADAHAEVQGLQVRACEETSGCTCLRARHVPGPSLTPFCKALQACSPQSFANRQPMMSCASSCLKPMSTLRVRRIACRLLVCACARECVCTCARTRVPRRSDTTRMDDQAAFIQCGPCLRKYEWIMYLHTFRICNEPSSAHSRLKTATHTNSWHSAVCAQHVHVLMCSTQFRPA